MTIPPDGASRLALGLAVVLLPMVVMRIRRLSSVRAFAPLLPTLATLSGLGLLLILGTNGADMNPALAVLLAGMLLHYVLARHTPIESHGWSPPVWVQAVTASLAVGLSVGVGGWLAQAMQAKPPIVIHSLKIDDARVGDSQLVLHFDATRYVDCSADVAYFVRRDGTDEFTHAGRANAGQTRVLGKAPRRVSGSRVLTLNAPLSEPGRYCYRHTRYEHCEGFAEPLVVRPFKDRPKDEPCFNVVP